MFLAARITHPQTMNMQGVENTAGFISSGTSIEPKTTSEFSPMVHRSVGKWTLMFHANAFAASVQQSGPRGKDKLFSTNWLMPMFSREFGRQVVTFRPMLSLEPATVTHRRYPELFQTGETAHGLPIVDGQHPHELFTELAVRYEFRFSDRTHMFLYGGPIGEPALGPTAYPHRASASENPVAVLGHHQEDSTHISNNVITLGVVSGRFQLEASTFHGREPNENRWDIDGGEPDSFSSRLTIAPASNFSGQFSIGRINNREALEPGLDTLRTTASIHHNLRLPSGHVASSVIWGRNKDTNHGVKRIFNSYTVESTVNFWKRNWVWARVENVDRDRSLLAGESPAALRIEEEPIGRVQAYSFGYERDLAVRIPFVNLGLGLQATVYGLTSQLKTVYGNHPAALVAFLRLRPSGNMAEHMRAMHGH
jgi:hypothetical protein